MEGELFFEAMATVGLPVFTLEEGDAQPKPANAAAVAVMKADPYAPYSGAFPRKRHSHRCDECAARGHRPVYCYKSKCTLGRRVRRCSWCR
jgi:hypothetical protein